MRLRALLKRYWSIPPHGFWRAVETENLLKIKEQFKEPVLDLGCGDGSFTGFFLNGWKNSISQGLDLSFESVKEAKRYGIHKGLIAGSATELPYKDSSFGMVFSNCAIEHIPELDKVLGEVARILTRGGRFVFTVPSERFCSCLFRYNRFMTSRKPKDAQRYLDALNQRLEHYHYLSPAQWTLRLEEKGMKVHFVRYYMLPRSMILWSKLEDMTIWRVAGRELHEYLLSRPLRYSGLSILLRGLIPALSLFYFRQAFIDEMKSTGSSGGALLILAEKS